MEKEFMIDEIKKYLWKQFGASVDMLEKAIMLCPNELYGSDEKFFYIAYHSIVFLDYYLTIPPKDFAPLLPFTIREADEIPNGALDDVIPDQFYSKSDLLNYLRACRQKAFQLISGITEKNWNARFVEDVESGAMNYPLIEILLYNMRHVQHHTAQLNMLLRENIQQAPKWVARATRIV